MAKGENIFKRKDGRWEARYVKDRDPSGKIRYGFCYGKTYREAKEKAAQQKLALCHERTPPQREPQACFARYCGEWLRLRSDQIRASTYTKYRSIIEKHIRPRLGSISLPEITTEAVDRFAKELLVEEKLSGKTVHDILAVLHGVLKYAAAQCPDSAPVEIHYPKASRREMRVLSPAEQQRFVRYLSAEIDACKFGVLLALFDLAEQVVCITSTLQRLPNTEAEGASRTRIVIGAPKSDTSARTIPLTRCAADLCRRFAVQNTQAYILTGTEAYMEPRTLQYRIQKYTRACGLDGVHAHTLRHTFATRAVEAGFEIKSLSEVLGHATTTITMERYVHSSMELKRTNMNKLTAVGL